MTTNQRSKVETTKRHALHARLLWAACPGWALVCVAFVLAGAVGTTLSLVTVGRFIGAIPAAIRDGIGSPAAAELEQWLIATLILIVALPVLSALNGWVEQLASARYVVHVLGLIAEIGIHPHGISHLDSPDVARRLQTLVQATRDQTFVNGLGATWSYLQARLAGIGAFIVLMSWRWWVPFIVTAAFTLQSRAFAIWISGIFDAGTYGTDENRQRAAYVRQLLTSTDAAKELRLFGLAGWLAASYATSWRAWTSVMWRQRSRSVRPTLLACLGVAVVLAAALGLLAHDGLTGAVSVSVIIVYLQAMLGLHMFGIIGEAPVSLGRLTSATAQLVKLRREVGLPPVERLVRPSTPDPTAQTRPRAAAEIVIDDLSFTYPTRDEPTIVNLSLHIPAGQSVAIVGVNGAGKSTLIKLLSGLYEPDSGTIRLDGGDPYVDKTTQRRVAVIFQDFVRYHLSLRHNVGFGNIDHLDDDRVLEQALADAGGSDLLDRVDHGWDTVLSPEYDGGTDLSGGQWQRIALARALAAVAGGAGVLILDEPTAALDVRAAAALFDHFLDVTHGITTILVSHRLSSVRHADRIIVLDGASDSGCGAIIEDGTHDDLLAADGHYATMFTLQAKRFADAGSGGDDATGDGESDATSAAVSR